MIQFSACINMMFTEIPFMERFKAAAAAGLTAVEFWGWSPYDLDAIQQEAQKHGLTISSICFDGTDEEARKGISKGISYGKETLPAFLSMIRESIQAAQKLDVKRMIVSTGGEHHHISRDEQHANIVFALREAAKLCEGTDIILVLEPLNILVNHPGYYLVSSLEGFDIIKEVNSPHLQLLFDIYHQQVSEGNLIMNITNHIGNIGHFHVADSPGRHEPGTGEINYPNVFASIEQSGYTGFVGLEYEPTHNTTDTLCFVRSTYVINQA